MLNEDRPWPQIFGTIALKMESHILAGLMARFMCARKKSFIVQKELLCAVPYFLLIREVVKLPASLLAVVRLASAGVLVVGGAYIPKPW